MLSADIERQQALAQAVSAARKVLTECEALAQVGHAAVADIDNALEEQAAISTLQREREQAADAMAAARAALHRATVAAVRQAMLRASKRYGELALEMTSTVAAVDAGMGLLPSRQQAEMSTGWHAHTLALLSVPAMPECLRVDDKGVVEMYFLPSLLRAQHPLLTLHQTAAAGWLRQQFGAALAPSGIPVHVLLV